MHHGIRSWFIECGVFLFVAVEVEIVLEIGFHFLRFSISGAKNKVAHEDIAHRVHVIHRFNLDTEQRIPERRRSNERIARIADVDLPRRIREPGKPFSLHKEAYAMCMSIRRVIFIPDVRKIEIPKLETIIERREEIAIAEDECARH